MNNFFENKNENNENIEITNLENADSAVEHNIYTAEESAAAQEIHTEEAPVSSPVFYKEVVEKKQKTPNILIASVLAAGLMFGTAFGFTVDNLLFDSRSNQKAVGSVNASYVVSKKDFSVEWIAETVSPSVVAIHTKEMINNFFFGSFENTGVGSGVIISSDGYIVTNNHVIEGATDIKVKLSSGKEYSAKLINRDPYYDVAVLKIDADNLPYAEFGDSEALKVGEPAIAIGNPLGERYAGTVTAGIISGLNREFENYGKKVSYIQTDAAINPGNSGGALVNYEGKVIGINTLKLADTNVEGMGFAIPSNEVKKLVDELINRPVLGISGRTITKEEAEQYKVPQGVHVAEVISGGGADKAGIKKGDIITHINGTRIMTIEALVENVKKYKIGDEVELEILNQLNRTVKIKVKLARNGE
ncbi:MAG: S1C family serine protease [Bacillota bacterium]